jgi:integrase
VPLVGEALWAAQRATAASHTGHLFPSYCDGQNTKANSASAALNKWLKAHVSRDVVVHSLRHAMRDRLRAAECPADVIDQIGGWSRKGVGESYGLGHNVKQLHRWMAQAVI